MSVIKSIKEQSRKILETTTQVKDLSSKLACISPEVEPMSVFPNINNAESKQLELVFVSLTVQDILETQFYYPYLIKKPVTKDSEIVVLKYGASDEQQHNNIKIQDYQAIMNSRETLVCLSDFYQTRWVEHQWKGYPNIQKPVQMKVDGQHQFKLGEKVKAVCVWNAFEQTLFFVRLATAQQILKHKLEFSQSIDKQQISPKESRQLLLDNFNKFCSPNQAMMLMYSTMSEQPMFIDGFNFKQQLQQILPRVSHVNLKAPLKSSLFPYKNEQGVLIQTPMQMSTAKTFVIIDFSQFSSEKQVKIGQQQIDNLKALKMFVEEGKTIYRWEYGESLLDHNHSGIIVKGSKIISPHFYINDNLQHKQKNSVNPFTDMDTQTKHRLRVYIQQCLKRKPTLSQQSRNEIEVRVKEQIAKNQSGKLMIKQIMQIARLNAKSMGRDVIEIEDYEFAKKFIN